MAGFLVPRRSMIVRRYGTLDSLVPEGHLARFVWWALCSVDFGPLEVKYPAASGGPGRPPYHPRVLAALWIYGMTQGMETAASISSACDVRDDFRWLAGGWRPSDQTLLNLLAHHDELGSIWVEALKVMHRAGHVDLSAIAEDGTKLRANASCRSFRAADELAVLIDELKVHVANKVKQLAGVDAEATRRTCREIRALRDRLERAERASLELRERAARQHGRREPEPQGAASEQSPALPSAEKPPRQFTSAEFCHDADRDVMVCPGGAELHFIGIYGKERGGAGYRLYSRPDCDGCSLKVRCTNAKGRRLKITLRERVPSVPEHAKPVAAPSTMESPRVEEPQPAPKPSRPRASLTDPEAVMMLATSEKRWAPSYNADLAVTRHGVIVSQFLTKHPTDYHAFGPALAAVVDTVGRPDSWVGDGHYGTQANLLLAHHAGVTLYAPPAGQAEDDEGHAQAEREDESSTPASSNLVPRGRAQFGIGDFRHDTERDVMICPANQELQVIGTYPTENGLRSYKLYGRTGCGGCPDKPRCTKSQGRRLKVVVEREPSSPETSTSILLLARDLQGRMNALGERVLAFRRQTVEPVNAQLKQHGVARFHVRGLARCSAVLTIACIAHNLMKWRAREVAHALKLAA